MATDDDSDFSEPMLTAAQARDLLETVSESTVYNWLVDGRLKFEVRDNLKLISAATLRRTPLLHQVDVLGRTDVKALKVTERDLATAFADGVVHPSNAPDRRYSLEDVEALKARKNGTWRAALTELESGAVERAVIPSASSGAGAGALSPRKPVPVEPDPFLLHEGRWPALVDYIANHGDPMRLPPAFWDTRSCPEFIPPAGVFRFTYWLPFALQFDDGEIMPQNVGIRRSAGWVVLDAGADGQQLFEEPEDDMFDSEEKHVWPPGKEAQRYGVFNLHWRSLRESWEQAWQLRRRQLRATGVDTRALPNAEAPGRRDRRAILRRYHEEGWAPSDLPDWFFDTDECPHFEAPNETCLLDYGEAAAHPQTGEPGTWIRCTGFHNWVMGPNALEYKAGDDHFEWVPGAFPAGAVPARYEKEAHAYRTAQQEWVEEWRKRARFRRGED
jgi:hypothetical protein